MFSIEKEGDADNKKQKEDIVPATIMLVKEVQKIVSSRLLTVLFDTGATKTMINVKPLPCGCTPSILQKPIFSCTIEGTFETRRFVKLNGILFPEFIKKLKIEENEAYV